MPTVLTTRAVQKAIKDARRPGAARVLLRDSEEPGLRLVCGARSATWSFKTTLRENGERRDIFVALGDASTVSVEMARIEARRLKDTRRAGLDPVAERTVAAARKTTLGREVETWKPRGSAKHVRNDLSNIRSALAEMAVADLEPAKLQKQDVVRLVRMHEHRPATCRHRVGALKRFLDHLESVEIIETNVARLLPYRTQPAPPAPRNTYPTASETRRLWLATEGFNPDYRHLMRLLLLCPLRRTEATRLLASEVDLDRRAIRLSAKRMKNKRAFEMPLSREALAILEPRVAGLAPDAPVFGAVAVDWWRLLIQWRRDAAVETFSLHDLRRLFSTESGEHHIGDFDLIDGLLSHSTSNARSGATRSYQHAERAGDKRKLMQAWADLLGHAIETGRWPREIDAEAAEAEAAEKVVEMNTGRRRKAHA